MSDTFNPGDGWREATSPPQDQDAPELRFWNGEDWTFWVRVPPLPIEPGYYVDVDGCAWRLDAEGEWDDTFGNPTSPGSGDPGLPLVRYEPRAVTAGRIADWFEREGFNFPPDDWRNRAARTIRNEFGVES